jgi:hypothetical protein
MEEGVLPRETKTIGSNAFLLKNSSVLMESCKRVAHKFEGCGINNITSSQVAEL